MISRGLKPDLTLRWLDTVFTYAAPHNGIDIGLLGNLPLFGHSLGVADATRRRIIIRRFPSVKAWNTLSN